MIAVDALRIAKLVAVGVYFAGVLGAVFANAHPDRRRFAFRFAGPGFGATWLLGFALAGLLDRRVFSLWIGLTMVASMAALHAALYAAGRDGRSLTGPRWLASLALVASVALMVLRPGG